MRRWFLTIPAFLLLGAVVNVAVAWGCAAFVPPGYSYRGVCTPVPGSPSPDPQFDALAREHGARSTVDPERYANVGGDLTFGKAAVTPDDSLVLRLPSKESLILVVYRAGLPLRAFTGHADRIVREGYSSTANPLYKTGLRRLGLGALVPLIPIWPGFAVNTIFYAAILWPLILGPFALRRSLRVRRGLCPKCAYPMGESAVCTECGRALPERARTT